MSGDPSHTSAYKLFHYYFMCSIPASFAMQNRHPGIGTPILGSRQEEEDAAEEMVSRQHTPVEMAELFSRGARIILKTPSDSLKIYEWLQDHLQTKNTVLRTSIHPGKLPLEDLKILDAFATSLYRVARQYETNNSDARVGGMGRKLRKISYNRLTKRVPKSELTKEPELKEHNSITGDINRLAMRRGLPTNRKE